VVESVQKSSKMDVEEEESEGEESNKQQSKKAKIETTKAASSSHINNNSHNDDNMTVGSAGSDAKMDELRKKLQDRIILLKQQRKSKKPDTNNKKKEKEKQKEKSKQQQKKADNNNKSKQQQKKGGVGNDDDNHSLANSIDSSLDQIRSELIVNGNNSKFSSNNDVEADFEFNQITQMNKNDDKDGQKPGFHVAPGGTKKQRLQRLLDEAEKKRQRYQQLSKSTNPIEKQKLQSEQWNDILSSAAGKKTILVSSSSASDPSASSSSTGNGQMISKSEMKIKKALKRLEKKKEKSTIEWNERLSNVAEEKNKKQNKREENLAKRRKGGLEATLIDGEKAKEIQGGSNRNHSGNKVKINRPGQPQQPQQQQQQHNKHQSNDHHNKKPNRAGFEGKKSDGKFLNQK
jgi:hypothetical protein